MRYNSKSRSRSYIYGTVESINYKEMTGRKRVLTLDTIDERISSVQYVPGGSQLLPDPCSVAVRVFVRARAGTRPSHATSDSVLSPSAGVTQLQSMSFSCLWHYGLEQTARSEPDKDF